MHDLGRFYSGIDMVMWETDCLSRTGVYGGRSSLGIPARSAGGLSLNWLQSLSLFAAPCTGLFHFVVKVCNGYHVKVTPFCC